MIWITLFAQLFLALFLLPQTKQNERCGDHRIHQVPDGAPRSGLPPPLVINLHCPSKRIRSAVVHAALKLCDTTVLPEDARLP